MSKEGGKKTSSCDVCSCAAAGGTARFLDVSEDRTEGCESLMHLRSECIVHTLLAIYRIASESLPQVTCHKDQNGISVSLT